MRGLGHSGFPFHLRSCFGGARWGNLTRLRRRLLPCQPFFSAFLDMATLHREPLLVEAEEGLRKSDEPLTEGHRVESHFRSYGRKRNLSIGFPLISRAGRLRRRRNRPIYPRCRPKIDRFTAYAGLRAVPLTTRTSRLSRCPLRNTMTRPSIACSIVTRPRSSVTRLSFR